VTLIVGILCLDGVVVAADGAATYGVMGQHTVRQPMKKLRLLDDHVVIGVSGPGTLAQRFEGEVRRLCNAPWQAAGQQPDQAMLAITKVIRPHILDEMQMAQAAGQIIGQVARVNALSTTLVALPLGADVQLFQFDQQGSPEYARPDVPFFSIGSGQLTADPFLAFIRELFWRQGQPTVEEGIFAAHWTVRHAIETSPRGVADPIQLAVLDKATRTARELAEDELAYNERVVAEMKNTMREAAQKFLSAKEKKTESPPS